MLRTTLYKPHTYNPLKKYFHRNHPAFWNIPKYADIDHNYLCNSNNIPSIEENISKRKGVGDILLVQELHSQLNRLKVSDPTYNQVKEKFYKECLQIPNLTHPDVYSYGDEPKVLKYIGQRKHNEFPIKEFHEITKRLNLVRTEQLGNLSGNRRYYLLGEMAEYEQALVRYFVSNLLKNNFQLVSVPDILPRNVVESCGMNTRGDRTQVSINWYNSFIFSGQRPSSLLVCCPRDKNIYVMPVVYTLDPNLHEPDLCLSGTSEIALAGYLANEILDPKDLPLKLCSVSRCYRAETSSVAEERGIFRVHEFTKVEMFIASIPDQSDAILENIRALQEELFESLGIHCQVLDMPPHDLGAQAYRKYDIEAWMPGRNMYGEISSCSNCTDFQSRRLNIKYKGTGNSTGYVHTLNGTACAVPRLLIALTETYQENNGTISLPEVIQKYMGGKKWIGRQKKVPELKLIKNKK